MSSRNVVLIGWEPPAPQLLESLPDDVELQFANSDRDVKTLIGEADAAYLTAVDDDLLHRARRLRWIQAASGGAERFLIPALIDSKIELTSLKQCFDVAGAEHALAVILMWNRRLHVDARTDGHSSWSFDLPQEAAGQTVGIVGFGNIGNALADRAHALGMTVLALARTSRPKPANVDVWYSQGQLYEMVAACDFVVVATPLTSSTIGMVDAEFVSAMSSHAVLIDVTGRPAVYDINAISTALRAGSIGGAALQIPRADPNSLLWHTPNLLICLHRIVTAQEQHRTTQFFVDNVHRFAAGEPLAGLVDKHAGY